MNVTIIKGVFGWFVMVDDEPVAGPFESENGARTWADCATEEELTSNKPETA